MKNKITVLLCSNLIAVSAFASNSCDSENTFTYKGIECCLDEDLSKTSCIDQVNQLGQSYLNKFQKVKKSILKGEFKKGQAPNCFWTSLSFFDEKTFSKARTVFEYEINDELELLFNEVQSFVKGDLILYEGEVSFYSDIMGEYTVLLPFHSAIYLGEGLVFQKENSSDEVFSITSLKRSFGGYSNAFFEQNKNQLVKRVYRYKN